ncbi:Serine racemase [Coccomyxa sp. Obi]|nr:Serine racemase [Coccomyxa sp. Obi]
MLPQNIAEPLTRGWGWTETALSHIAREALAASHHIYPAVRVTELHRSPWLSARGECCAYLKLENNQVTGSFKARGATHKVLSLELDAVRRGLVTCSSGNHALAFLHACSLLPSLKGPEWAAAPLIYLPKSVSDAKASKLKQQGAQLVLFGDDAVEAEREARRIAAERGMTYISPYNDPQVAGGQGTIALELLSQLPAGQLDAVFVPVGGGGLVSGIATVLAAVRPEVRVIGCQPANSCVMMQSVRAGRILNLPSTDTLSDGTAGGVEEGSVTFQPCCEHVDEWVTVEEHEIAEAMVGLKEAEGICVEGSAGVSLASLLKTKERWTGKRVAIVCCGGNISQETFAKAELLARTHS